MTVEQQARRTLIDKLFPLLLFGGVGIGFIVYGGRLWRKETKATTNNPQPFAETKTTTEKPIVPPIPKSFENEVGELLDQFGKYNIDLNMADLSPASSAQADKDFVEKVWSECHNLTGTFQSAYKTTIRDFPSFSTPLFFNFMQEFVYPATLKNVLTLPWDIENFTDDYEKIAISLVNLSQGDLPLENIEEVILDKEGRSRELRFKLKGENYTYGYEVKMGLNLELLQQLASLMLQQNTGYRFALIEDDEAIIIRIQENQLESFCKLFDAGICKGLEKVI